MSGSDLTTQKSIPATELTRYSVQPTDIQSVRQQLNAADKCHDQMVRQYIEATGGDLTTVGITTTKSMSQSRLPTV